MAHGTGYEVLDGHPVAVQLYYTGGEAMPYVEARVFSPADASAPFQQSRADRLGRVTFYPDRPGSWRLVAVDGEGHAVRAEITVAGNGKVEQLPAANKRGERRQWLLASMLVNLGLFLALFWNRGKAGPQSGV
ncbi:MAG: hypothetical protein LH632_12850 [Rhodoferax sp.]|nr:hypothetical protein [Rhodoferax sp.]